MVPVLEKPGETTTWNREKASRRSPMARSPFRHTLDSSGAQRAAWLRCWLVDPVVAAPLTGLAQPSVNSRRRRGLPSHTSCACRTGRRQADEREPHPQSDAASDQGSAPLALASTASEANRLRLPQMCSHLASHRDLPSAFSKVSGLRIRWRTLRSGSALPNRRTPWFRVPRPCPKSSPGAGSSPPASHRMIAPIGSRKLRSPQVLSPPHRGPPGINRRPAELRARSVTQRNVATILLIVDP